jgi:hypothetical protein
MPDDLALKLIQIHKMSSIYNLAPSALVLDAELMGIDSRRLLDVKLHAHRACSIGYAVASVIKKVNYNRGSASGFEAG